LGVPVFLFVAHDPVERGALFGVVGAALGAELVEAAETVVG